MVDDVTYDDAVPWPLTPDGIAPGPSLELTNLNSDNSLAANWAASTVPYGTPAAVNCVETAPPLTITDAATAPAQPGAQHGVQGQRHDRARRHGLADLQDHVRQ